MSDHLYHLMIPWQPEPADSGASGNSDDDGYCCDWCCPATIACTGANTDGLARPKEDAVGLPSAVTCEACRLTEAFRDAQLQTQDKTTEDTKTEGDTDPARTA